MGADDLDEKIRATTEVRVAKTRLCLIQRDRDVRDPVILFPASFSIADVDNEINLSQPRPINRNSENRDQSRADVLVFQVWRRRHDISSLPNLVKDVTTPLGSLRQKLLL